MNLNDYHEIFMKTLEEAILEKANTEELDWDNIQRTVADVQKKIIPDTSRAIYNSLINEMPKMIDKNRLDEVGFEARLQDKWLKPFYLMGAIIQIIDELTHSEIEEFYKDVPLLNTKEFEIWNVFFKIQSRAILIAREIFKLVKSGFPDGAMARWRSLHENNVILRILVSKMPDIDTTYEIVRKYLDYGYVEEWNEFRIYKNIEPSFQLEQVDNKYSKFINSKREELEMKYGKKFFKPYSWCKSLINKDRIFFSDLEKLAGVDRLAIYYKKANYQIHSSPTGIFNSISILPGIDQSQYYISGSSNYGLSTPSQLTVISLYQITVALTTLKSNMDRLTILEVIKKFVDECKTEFDRIENEIKHEEKMKD